MKRLAILTILLLVKLGLFAQVLPFTKDNGFQPYFDFRKDTVVYINGSAEMQNGGRIKDIWEDTATGKIYIAGEFGFHHNENYKFYDGHICFQRNGSIFEKFHMESSGHGSYNFFKISDTVFFAIGSSSMSMVDTLGNYYNSWRSNIRESVPCRTGAFPLFFKDGSSLWSNRQGNFNGCDIVLPPDTFPHRYIVKVDPEGKWDSTFTIDADGSGIDFIPYDSNRILMYANTRFIYQYDGHTVNGVWRIYLDGTLDTTFHAPISDAWVSGHARPVVEEDGKIFLLGYFLLEGQNRYSGFVRLNADGSLDSTFMNFSGPIISGVNDSVGSAYTVAPTPDGGYLVAGYFNKYQGHQKNGIAKINYNGVVEPQYFTGSGPGDEFFLYPEIYEILPSAFGGYYLIGNFRSWNGQPSQPIIRLHGLNVGMEEHGQEVQELKLFPNPAMESIQFYGIGANEIEQLFLTDIQGKTLKVDFRETSLNTYEMNISNLKTGMYFLKIISDGEVGVGKFVKE